MAGLPEPWGSILSLVLGPGGALVFLGLTIYFLWKLFREEQAENRANFQTVATSAKAIEALTIEVRAWRDVYDVGPRSIRPRARKRANEVD